MATAADPVPVSFEAHLELLRAFVAKRDSLAEAIQELLNAQRRPAAYLEDRALLSRSFEDVLFRVPWLSGAQQALRGQLKAAHWASGFRPRDMPAVFNDLVDPGEMAVRAFNQWRQTRWPGRNARLRYAHTLLNLYILRQLALLSMRLWDSGPEGAGTRLAALQNLLEQLWKSSPADQPVLVRDVRWLIPLAQSPTTEDLAPYFTIAEQIATSLSEADRAQIHRASIVFAGGHLRSQLRHYILKKGVSLEENTLVLSSRSSNALDFALTLQGLVTLLTAYEHSLADADDAARQMLASAICQGLSADPELFVNRLDLLCAYSMIETLFITEHEGHAAYTPIGQRHRQQLRAYSDLIERVARPLAEDCRSLRPLPGRYSPYGLIYGFSSNLLEHMALKSLQADATPYCLEDAFSESDSSPEKLEWVAGWRKLPHIRPEVQRLFEYPQSFAEAIYLRIERALRRRADGEAVPKTGKLYLAAAGHPPSAPTPELASNFVESSDAQLVAAGKAHGIEQSRLLHERGEGSYLASYSTCGGWTAISKDLLTEVLGAGRDAAITGLPAGAQEILKLMMPDLLN